MKHLQLAQFLPNAELLIFFLAEQDAFPLLLKEIDECLRGGVLFNIRDQGFNGGIGQHLYMTTNGMHKIPKILLIGLGDRKELSPLSLEQAGASLCSLLDKTANGSIVIDAANLEENHSFVFVALGINNKLWTFDKYKNSKDKLKSISFLISDEKKHADAWNDFLSLYKGIKLARELNSEPANALYPEVFADRCLEAFGNKVSVKIYDEIQLSKMGAHALLAVGQGSARPPRMVVLQWKGASNDSQPITLVGKGICYDSGGINLKTSHLAEMKWDKAGASVVAGTMYAAALLNLPVNIIGILGLAENMPDGASIKPGDIITTLSGKTVEIEDTDNEGRLVLADCLSFAQQFSPQTIIDLGTLTLECFGALAGEYAGLFCENRPLSEKLIASGEAVGEKLWPLPMGPAFAKQIQSSVADIKNMGVSGFGESSAAAEFLKCFVDPKTPWAHLDIAGVAWSQGNELTAPGVTGFGVKLLVDLLKKYG